MAKEALTYDSEVSDTGDLAGLVPRDALVSALILGERPRDGEAMHAPIGLHLEVLRRLDHLAVVVPLHHRVWQGGKQ